MTPEEYKTIWKRYVHDLKGDGEEAKRLLKEMESAWKAFSPEQQTEAANLICGGYS